MSVKGSGSEGSHCTGEFYPMGAWGGRGGGGQSHAMFTNTILEFTR